MNIFLYILIPFVYFTMYGQTTNELEKEKNDLLKTKSELELNKKKLIAEYDSTYAEIKLQKQKIDVFISQMTYSKDSIISKINELKISSNNLKSYEVLCEQKIINPDGPKFENYSKKICKNHFLPKNEKMIVTTEYLCFGKIDENGRFFSSDMIKLSEDEIMKQKKMLLKNSIDILEKNDLILEKFTGVNSIYLSWIRQVDKIKVKIDSLNAELKIAEQNLDKLYQLHNQQKMKLDDDTSNILARLNKINEQIAKIELQNKIEAEKVNNYSKYKTRAVNGIEICTTPISINKFRNGDEIKKARTEGEWNKFNELKIPAYHLKDFNDEYAGYGFIYNFYAIIDSRELAPYGFHKLNAIDFNHLENQILSETKKLVNCICGDGTLHFYKSCRHCLYWSESQREYNICPYCHNRKFSNHPTIERCSICNGTKKKLEYELEERIFCFMPTTTNNVAWGGDIWDSPTIDDENLITDENSEHLLAEFKIKDGKCKSTSLYTYDIYKGYQIIICKDRFPTYTDNFNFTKIGDIEIMNTYLGVTKFCNGDPIKYISDPVEWELALKNNIPAYCYFNNVNAGNGCIYNKHVWTDKRGVLPNNWRSLTKYDVVNAAISLKSEFELPSLYLPLKPPTGKRLKDGTFVVYNEEDIKKEQLNFSLKYDELTNLVEESIPESGLILCVRDATNLNKINSDNNFENSKSFNVIDTGNQSRNDQINSNDAGSVDGSGSGSGSGGYNTGIGRMRLNNITLPSYKIDFDCRIGFFVQVNCDGQVVGVRNIKSITTCLDERLINEIKEIIKREVKYNKAPGSEIIELSYVFDLKASN